MSATPTRARSVSPWVWRAGIGGAVTMTLTLGLAAHLTKEAKRVKATLARDVPAGSLACALILHRPETFGHFEFDPADQPVVIPLTPPANPSAEAEQGNPATQLPDGDNVEVLLVFGDSLAAGTGADTFEQSMPVRLADEYSRMTGCHVLLVNVAYPGNTSNHLLRQAANAAKIIEELKNSGKWPNKEPLHTLCLVGVGPNNVQNGVPPQKTVAGFTAWVKALKTMGIDPASTFVVDCAPPIAPGFGRVFGRVLWVAFACQAVLQTLIARHHQMPVIDLFRGIRTLNPALKASDFSSQDNIHLNSSGQLKWAHRVMHCAHHTMVNAGPTTGLHPEVAEKIQLSWKLRHQEYPTKTFPPVVLGVGEVIHHLLHVGVRQSATQFISTRRPQHAPTSQVSQLPARPAAASSAECISCRRAA